MQLLNAQHCAKNAPAYLPSGNRPASASTVSLAAMGKKRKIEEGKFESYEEDRGPAEYSHAHNQHAGGSRVEAETVSYLQEVSQHFSTLTDAEEKELLLANVLEEIQGKELRIASDAVTSRLLEQLIAGATAAQLMQFMQAFTNEDMMFSLAGSAFGSHVAEKVLAGLHHQAGQLDSQQAEQLEQLLAGMVGAIGSNLYDYIMDKHATHVARALLVVIAGRGDVLSPAVKKKQQQQQQQQQQQSEEGTEQHAAAAAAAAGNAPAFKSSKSSLREKLVGSRGSSGSDQAARYPALLRRYAKMLPCYDASNMGMLGKNSYSSPFIQAVLRAAAADEELLLLLLPPILGVDSSKAAAAAPGQVLATLTDSHVGRLLRDDCYSHLLEVVMTVMPTGLGDEFYSRFLKGRLLPLTNHHSANFVIQAWLAAANSSSQVQGVLDELSSHLADLLKRRRSGVIAALMAAAGRAAAAAQQAAAVAALAAALGQLPQWQGKEGTGHLAPALLTLDTNTTMSAGSSSSSTHSHSHHQQQQQQQQQWHSSSSAGGGLSTPGSAILATILTSYSRKAAKPFVESVIGLNPGDAVRAAKDPAGSRALQALIEGAAAGTEAKSQLLSKLTGSWGDIALQGAGSFFLEKAYSHADLAQREIIVAEVAQRQSTLMGGCHWGPLLARKLGVEAYLRSPEEWRKRAASAAAAAKAFEQILAQETPATGKKRKRQQQQQQEGYADVNLQGTSAGADVGRGSGSSIKQQKKKIKQEHETAAALIVEQQQQQQQQATIAAAAAAAAPERQDGKGTKKKRKHSAAADVDVGVDVAGGDNTTTKHENKPKAKDIAIAQQLDKRQQKKEKKKRKRSSSPQAAAAGAAGVGDGFLELLGFGGLNDDNTNKARSKKRQKK